MSATISMLEVVPNVKYVGNPIMDRFRDFWNHPRKDDIENEIARRYGYDPNNHTYDEWHAAYNDVMNNAYIDETTGQFIPFGDISDEHDEFGFTALKFFDLGDYRGVLKGRKARPMLRQIKKLRDLGVVQKHNFNPTGTYEYVPVRIAKLGEHPVYRQGWFFKNKWLNSDMPIIVCTSYDNLKKSLDRVIDVTSRDADMNKRGVEAYQYFLMAFKKLTEQNPDKKYFVEISF